MNKMGKEVIAKCIFISHITICKQRVRMSPESEPYNAASTSDGGSGCLYPSWNVRDERDARNPPYYQHGVWHTVVAYEMFEW